METIDILKSFFGEVQDVTSPELSPLPFKDELIERGFHYVGTVSEVAFSDDGITTYGDDQGMLIFMKTGFIVGVTTHHESNGASRSAGWGFIEKPTNPNPTYKVTVGFNYVKLGLDTQRSLHRMNKHVHTGLSFKTKDKLDFLWSKIAELEPIGLFLDHWSYSDFRTDFDYSRFEEIFNSFPVMRTGKIDSEQYGSLAIM